MFVKIFSKTARSRRALTLAGISLILAGCGVKGSLKTPPPLWGDLPEAETSETDDSVTDSSADN